MKKTAEEILTEQHLTGLGFSKHVMPGTGWNSIGSMCDAVFYYENGRISINATKYWTWFLDNEQRNDISVNTVCQMNSLLKKYNHESNSK